MTFVTMRWVQEHALDVFKATKTVLAYLAMKAHFDDGTAAWPAMETIATECGLSVRTVQRSIDQLVDVGYLELGQQDFSRIDPRTGRQVRADRRTVVWNVVCRSSAGSDLMGAEPVEEQRRDDGMETCVRHARTVAERRRTVPAADDCRNVTPCDAEMSPRDSGTEDARGDIFARNPAKMSPNIQEIHYYPSAPSGHLPTGASHAKTEKSREPDAVPASDAPPGDGDVIRWTPAPPLPDDDDPVGRFLTTLAVRRGALGLTTRPAGGRDRRAVAALIDRLREQGEPDPPGLMGRVLAAALDSDWQAKRCDSGSRFARLFDELRNDMAVDQRRRARLRQAGLAAGEPKTSETAPPAKPHRHTWRCRHTLAALNRSEQDADRFGPDETAVATADELNRCDAGDMDEGRP